MELTKSEIDVLVDHYRNNIEWWNIKLDSIREDTNFDADLRKAQIDRYKDKIAPLETRLRELLKLRETL